jgi:hypothetical protein
MVLKDVKLTAAELRKRVNGFSIIAGSIVRESRFQEKFCSFSQPSQKIGKATTG